MAVILCAPAAHAQTTDAATDDTALQAIIVTATKRATTLQETPLSVSVVDGTALKASGTNNLEGIGNSIPNFSVAATPIGDTITIRGINTFTQPGTEQSVSTFVDGVFRGRGTQSRFAFLDVGTIEVVRGPQGTLFGKNTVAGALNISSARPTTDLNAALIASYEFNAHETDLAGHVSGPVADWLRVRAAVQYNNLSKGWVYNPAYDETLPRSQSVAFRFSAEADISSDVTAYAKIERGTYRVNGQPYDIVGLFEGDRSRLSGTARFMINALVASGEDFGLDRQANISNAGVLDIGEAFRMRGTNDEAMARIDWNTGAGVLTGIVADSRYYFNRVLDGDNGPVGVIRTAERENYNQQSAELRFASEKFGSFSFLLGLFHQRSDLAFNEPADGVAVNFAALGLAVPAFNRSAEFDQKSTLWSGFAQATYEFTPQLSLTGGVRYNRDSKRATQSTAFYNLDGTPASPSLVPTFSALLQTVPHTVSPELDERDTTYAFNLKWDASRDLMIYASHATGVKGGGFNAYYYGTTGQGTAESDAAYIARLQREVTFRPEKSTAYELGGKLSIGASAQLNLAIFYNKFDSLQVTQFTGSTNFVVQNAAKADAYGVEFDGRWKVSRELELFGNAAWLRFRFTDYKNAGCTVIQAIDFGNNVAACSDAGGNDLTGRTNQNAPEWTSTLGFQYSKDVSDSWALGVRGDVNYTDGYYAANDLDPNTYQSAFAKINAVVSMTHSSGIEMALVGRNLTNKLTFADANDLPLTTGSYRVSIQRPRSVALRLKAGF